MSDACRVSRRFCGRPPLDHGCWFVPRSRASSIGPAIAGFMPGGPFSGLPVAVCGCLRIGYDLALRRMLRRTKPPEAV